MHNMKNNNFSNLPQNINQINPTPKENAKSITAVVKSSNKIVGYKLSDDNIISKQEGINMAISGDIKDVGVAVNKGTQYLRTLPDGNQGNNLSNLPVITQ